MTAYNQGDPLQKIQPCINCGDQIKHYKEKINE